MQLTSVLFRDHAWRDGVLESYWHVGPRTALVEAYITCSIVDTLLPHQHIVIELLGGAA